nr:probable aspartyl aminopeptidase isoform X2 [Tanacetum cinerariifolium]
MLLKTSCGPVKKPQQHASFKDPEARYKLEMIKSIRAQRAASNPKISEAILRATLIRNGYWCSTTAVTFNDFLNRAAHGTYVSFNYLTKLALKFHECKGGVNSKQICWVTGVKLHDFAIRNNMGCGSIIGPILASGIGIHTVDYGIPQLSMHRSLSCNAIGVGEAQGEFDFDRKISFFASCPKQLKYIYKSLSELKSNESEADGALAIALQMLKKIHNMFFDLGRGEN